MKFSVGGRILAAELVRCWLLVLFCIGPVSFQGEVIVQYKG